MSTPLIETPPTHSKRKTRRMRGKAAELRRQMAGGSGIAVQSSSVALPKAAEKASSPRRADPEVAELFDSFHPSKLSWKNVDWVVLGFIAAVHLGCLAAPFFFSWTALAVGAVIYWMTASIGICLGYHRYLSHRSLKLKPVAEAAVLFCGAMSAEGSPLTWAATHRLHHQRSDKEGDPHSPFHGGGLWSHLLWLFVYRSPAQREVLYRRYVPELASNKMLLFFEKTYGWWLLVIGLGLLAAGYFLIGGFFGAMSMLLWAMCVRTTVAYHGTWFVNSATHLWGYRTYETRDESKNLWWVALFAFGEGWHNNHHAHPALARAGHKWWEIDMTFWVIRLLQVCGLATNVKDGVPATQAAAIDHSDAH